MHKKPFHHHRQKVCFAIWIGVALRTTPCNNNNNGRMINYMAWNFHLLHPRPLAQFRNSIRIRHSIHSERWCVPSPMASYDGVAYIHGMWETKQVCAIQLDLVAHLCIETMERDRFDSVPCRCAHHYDSNVHICIRIKLLLMFPNEGQTRRPDDRVILPPEVHLKICMEHSTPHKRWSIATSFDVKKNI